MELTVGLFGTCGGSTWRDKFMICYTTKGIAFFNPQKDDWKAEDAIIEAEHLASDPIILFPITDETYATGSLSEIGFSILNAIKINHRRDFVVFVDTALKPELIVADSIAAKESVRARALILSHLRRLELDNLYLVNSLEEMLDLSLTLVEIEKIRATIRHFNPSS